MKSKLYNAKILKYAKKSKAVDYLGGSCKNCNETEQFKLTFHHRDMNEKEFQLSDYRNHRWSLLKLELDKCDVLCQNCHRELHYGVNKDTRRLDKSIYLEYAGVCCIKCNYNKCPAALTFHHRDPEEKEFWIGSLNERMTSSADLNDTIKSEIDKCDVLCANCHTIEHSDIDFFNENKKEILEKVNRYKETQPKIDREIVFKMLNDGMKQYQIAKHFNASKGTISDIVRGRINKNKPL